MTDDELRRRLFRQQLGELVVIAAAVGFIGYWSWTLFASAFQHGAITLYAGGRAGPKAPVLLKLNELPWGVVGVLLVYGAFAGLIARIVASSAYHVVRTGVPRLRLPRVPRNKVLRAVSVLHIGAMLLVGSFGIFLVFVQYLLLGAG